MLLDTDAEKLLRVGGGNWNRKVQRAAASIGLDADPIHGRERSGCLQNIIEAGLRDDLHREIRPDKHRLRDGWRGRGV